MPLPEAPRALMEDVVGHLIEVDAVLQRQVDHRDPFIAEAGGHLLRAGGKRFRPMLTLLASYVGDGPNPSVVAAAAAVELTHLASLYHDDVMDEADVRRGAQSANARYGNSQAILVGDLLFGKASAVVADLGPDAVRIQANTFVRLCDGQIRDDRPCPPDQDPVEYYLGVLADKTGSLIATAAQYGGMFSGCDAATVEVLRQYGEQVGIAFQLADDLLDITGATAESGKEPGTDLREGVQTLPMLYVREGADPADARLLELLDSDLRDDTLHAEALGLLRAHPAVERARRRTGEIAEEAHQLLDSLGDGEAIEALQGLLGSVVDRSS